jgi:hypothetical protein
MNDLLKVAIGTLPALWGALGVLVGYVAKWLSDEASSRRQSERERIARREARLDALLQRRSEFQRENLLALQEASSRLVRCAGIADVQNLAAGGKWGETLYSKALSDAFRLAQVDTLTRQSRARDDDLRVLTERFRSACEDVRVATSQDASRAALDEAQARHKELMDLTGMLLRTLEDVVLAEAERHG